MVNLTKGGIAEKCKDLKAKITLKAIIIFFSFAVLGFAIFLEYDEIIILKEKILDVFKNKGYEEKNENVSTVKAIIGIDIGSTTSGFTTIYEPFNDSDSTDVSDLIDSQILIERLFKKGLTIGKNCYNFLRSLNSNYLYFTSFKRNLDPKINNKMISPDYPGDSEEKIELEIIINEFLILLKKEIENSKPSIKRLNETEKKWIITVPPLWDNDGKKLMADQAKKAGMVNIEIVLEPEAASLAIFNEDNPIIEKFKKINKTFLIVDAGGYTVDFSANKILENNNLEQLIIPISIVNGSSILNDKIFEEVKKFVVNNIGEDKFKTINFTIIKRILNDIENVKKSIDEAKGKDIEINVDGLDIKSCHYFDKSKECEIEIEGKKYLYTDTKLFIDQKSIYEMILKTSEDVKKYVNEILSVIGSVDLIIFTGGFSQNKIFHDYIIKSYEGRNSKVAFMKEPQKSVMKGAALFGLKPTQIVKRKIPITIGIESYEKKQTNESKSESENNEEEYIHQFILFVKKGDSIDVSEFIQHKIHPHPDNEKIIIYFNYEDEITNDNKKEFADIELPLNEIPVNERHLAMKMSFSNYINVTIIDETDESDIKENSVLLSYPVNKFF